MHAINQTPEPITVIQKPSFLGACLYFCYVLLLLVAMWISVVNQLTQWNSHRSISNCGKCMDLQHAAGNENICNHQSCDFSFWKCSEEINKFIIRNQFENKKRSLYAINESDLVLGHDEYVDFNKTVPLKDVVNSEGFENELSSAFICSLILAILTTILGIYISYYIISRSIMLPENLRDRERNRDALINVQGDEAPRRSGPLTWTLSSCLLWVTIFFTQMVLYVTYKANIPQLIEMNKLEQYHLDDILFNSVSCMHIVVGYKDYDTTTAVLWFFTLGFIFSYCFFGMLYYCGTPQNSCMHCCSETCGPCAVFLAPGCGLGLFFYSILAICKISSPIFYIILILTMIVTIPPLCMRLCFQRKIDFYALL